MPGLYPVPPRSLPLGRQVLVHILVFLVEGGGVDGFHVRPEQSLRQPPPGLVPVQEEVHLPVLAEQRHAPVCQCHGVEDDKIRGGWQVGPELEQGKEVQEALQQADGPGTPVHKGDVLGRGGALEPGVAQLIAARAVGKADGLVRLFPDGEAHLLAIRPGSGVPDAPPLQVGGKLAAFAQGTCLQDADAARGIRFPVRCCLGGI